MSKDFIVDTDWKGGVTRTTDSFATQAEAVAHAAGMAMDSRVAFSGVRNMAQDATIDTLTSSSSTYDLIDAGENAYESKIPPAKIKAALSAKGLNDKQIKLVLNGYSEAKRDANYFK